MKRRSRSIPVAVLAALLLTASTAGPAAAHALHGNVDAPLPFVAYIVGAAIAVALSFVIVAITDDTPLPEPRPGHVRTLPRLIRLLLRSIGLLAWLWVVLQTLLGGDSDAEVASLVLWVFGWVGLALVSSLLGPVWSWLDPFSTLYDMLATLFRPIGLRLPGRAPWHRNTGVWPAVILMGFFVWLELGPRVASGRDLGCILTGYTIFTLGAMAWYGRNRWRAHGEVFSVWFSLLGRLANWGPAGPPGQGRIRRRGFGSALSRTPWSASLLAVLALATGSVIWDGISQTRTYYDLVGEPGVVFETILLGGFLGLLLGSVLLVGHRVGMASVGAGLVPVAVGYLVAHYLTFLLTEGQRIVVAASDPLQQGWDLFGTVRWEPREDWLAGSVIWTVQVSAVVIGHVVGAWMGHSGIRRSRSAGKAVSQWPLAVLMIGMTMLALWSLGQNLVFVTDDAGAAAEVLAALRW